MSHEFLDFLGHIGYAFLALGILLLARKNILGWVCRFIGEATWLFIGWEMKMSSIWVWGTIFLFIEVYGFLNWRKTAQQSSSTK